MKRNLIHEANGIGETVWSNAVERTEKGLAVLKVIPMTQKLIGTKIMKEKVEFNLNWINDEIKKKKGEKRMSN